jgi:hypothetical protein
MKTIARGVVKLIRLWLRLTNRKCRFYHNNRCAYVVKDGWTCNHDREARGFCGKYRENLFREYKLSKIDKFQKKNR